jgi:hypothetical protein
MRKKKDKAAPELWPEYDVSELPVILDTPEFRECLTDWLAYKKERKEPYKPTGFRMMLKLAERNAKRYGVEALVKAMVYAMGKQWQGWDHDICWQSAAQDDDPFGGPINVSKKTAMTLDARDALLRRMEGER